MKKFVVVCDDFVIDNFISFYNSFKNKIKGNYELVIIPFSNNMSKIEKFACIHNLEIYKISDAQSHLIDLFVEKVYGNKLPQDISLVLGKLRKLLIFDFIEPCIYIDVDVLITGCKITEIFNTDKFSYFSQSTEWVYNESGLNEIGLTSKLFSTFLFYKPITKNKIEIFNYFLNGDIDHFNAVRKVGVVDQPILNYYFDRQSVTIDSIPEIIDCSPLSTIDSNLEITIIGDNLNDHMGKQIQFLHMPSSMPKTFVWNILFNYFADYKSLINSQ